MASLTESYAAGPAVPLAGALTLGDLLRRAAGRSPTQPALRVARSAGEIVASSTYAELLADSELCARRLLSMFTPGDRIAVWADNRAEWVVLQFGAALAGLVLVTVNPAFTVAEAKHVLQQSRARGCFAVADYRGVALITLTRQLSAELADLEQVYDLDDWAAFAAGPLAPQQLPVVGPTDPAMIQYTSGTTGVPKGALLLHGRLTANAEQVALKAGLSEESVWLAPLPLFHAGGCVVAVLGAVSRQATLVLMTEWNAQRALELVEVEHVEIINAVPTMLLGMLGHADALTRDLRSLSSVLAGGAVVSADIVRELQERLGVRVFIIFGQTECGPVATMTHAGDSPEDKQNTVGQALAGFEVRIVDRELGTTLPIGELGEFVARGPTMAGYYENDSATAAAFDADGWLHTGDLCSMDERGYVRVEGRIRDMIIRGGENIYPREIEELLTSHPAVEDVAVVGLPDLTMGERVGAFVVLRNTESCDIESLTEFLRPVLARYKLPTEWVVITALPRTPTGKVRKFVLVDQWKAAATSPSTIAINN